MPTPMFKVLAQSLRLGQPPDATSAVRVLVEAIEKQSSEIEDLRAKLAIANSRLQYAEARLGRILEASEDLGREESPPSSLHHEGRAHAPAPAQQAQPQTDAGRGSQRPPPMPAQSAPPGPPGPTGRAASVRPPAIPHALPIPQAPALPQGLTNPHPPLNIPQPMPLPPPGGAPPAPHQPSLAHQSALLQQMAQPPLVPQNTPPGGVPAIPRAPAIPGMGAIPATPKPPKLADLVEDGGFDEFNQTLVINKRDVAQLAREAPFPLHPAGHPPPGPAVERSRANTSATPFQPQSAPSASFGPASGDPSSPHRDDGGSRRFMQPGLQPPPAPAMQAATPPAVPQQSKPQPNPQPHAAMRQHTGSRPAVPVLHEREPAQDGTKTGIHPHRPAPEPVSSASGGPASIGLAPRPGIDPPLAALASANITDEDDAGSDADFTLTDQTARVDLSGLAELERDAGIGPSSLGPSSAGRAPRNGD
jgi:hypothetical protein